MTSGGGLAKNSKENFWGGVANMEEEDQLRRVHAHAPVIVTLPPAPGAR